jgi:DNA-binding MarR family transcriptional regulator
VATVSLTWNSAVVAILQPNGQQPTDLSSAVHDAAAALAVLWTRSAEGLTHQVSASQLRALICIQRAGTTNLTHLAEALGAMLSSASRLCDRLVAAGLVERSPSVANRRELSLCLTQDGTRLLARIDAQRRADIDHVLARMSPAARSALLTGLEAFTDAADSSHAAPSRSESC